MFRVLSLRVPFACSMNVLSICKSNWRGQVSTCCTPWASPCCVEIQYVYLTNCVGVWERTGSSLRTSETNSLYRLQMSHFLLRLMIRKARMCRIFYTISRVFCQWWGNYLEHNSFSMDGLVHWRGGQWIHNLRKSTSRVLQLHVSFALRK